MGATWRTITDIPSRDKTTATTFDAEHVGTAATAATRASQFASRSVAAAALHQHF